MDYKYTLLQIPMEVGFRINTVLYDLGGVWLTRWMPRVVQELITLPDHTTSSRMLFVMLDP
jgi:hypothetical protein